MAKSGLGPEAGSAAAVTVIKRALELESESRYPQALVCYQEGIDLLLQVLKGTKDETKRCTLRKRISEYMDRAENIKKYLDQEKEGKEAVWRVCGISCGKAHFTACFCLCPLKLCVVWTIYPGSLQICSAFPLAGACAVLSLFFFFFPGLGKVGVRYPLRI
uniref:MIT domain-containing protein 1 n=1 Tax=Sus scrofa TaxID=9823 RepID=A0A8D0UNX5_PIG